MPGFPNLRLAPPNRILDLKDQHAVEDQRHSYRHARLSTPTAMPPALIGVASHGHPSTAFFTRNLPNAVYTRQQTIRETDQARIRWLGMMYSTCLHKAFTGIADCTGGQCANFEVANRTAAPPPSIDVSGDHGPVWQKAIVSTGRHDDSQCLRDL